jgi:transcriptional repressor NrdR
VRHETTARRDNFMKCPYCNYEETKVIDSRPTEDFTSIRRRRECLKCMKRFTTYETVETIPVLVIKKDGSRQSFNKRKILDGLLKACEKRPVSMSELENLVDEIEKNVYNSLDQEITSKEIGEMVMSKLRCIDEVSYVRFASVYRQFKDINTFMNELNKILNSK